MDKNDKKKEVPNASVVVPGGDDAALRAAVRKAQRLDSLMEYWIVRFCACLMDNGWKYTIWHFLSRIVRCIIPAKPVVKVSVIVPAYNAAKYIDECIQSILKQSLREIELICVDDGSTDSTREIIKGYAKRDKRVRLATQKTRFAGVARNKGMKRARGEFLVFLDADDFFEPTMLSKMYAKAKSDLADVCLCAADRYDEQTRKHSEYSWPLVVNLLPKTLPFSYADCRRTIFIITTPAPWNKMFRRKFVKENKLRFQNLIRTNDLYFVMSALALAKRITVVPDVLVHYRTGQSTSLQGSYSDTPTLFCQALSQLRQKLQREGLWDDLRAPFTDMALNTSTYHYKLLSDKPLEDFIAQFRARYVKEFGIFDYDRDFYTHPGNFDVLWAALK